MSSDHPTTIVKACDGPRFNALKHGILSRQVVLPHESLTEFEQLQSEVFAEYHPVGITESMLAEELAGIIWRKRRLLMAEGAMINSGIKRALRSTTSVINSAVPMQMHRPGMEMDDDTGEVRGLLAMSHAELEHYKSAVVADKTAIDTALAIIKDGGIRAGKRAVATLTDRLLDLWISQGGSENQAEVSLFLDGRAADDVRRRQLNIRYVEDIRRHVEGRGVSTADLDKLARYEAHLDRKFEKTVGMLLKLRSIHDSASNNSQVID